MKLLSLDIGTRHTGVAYYDSAIGVVMPLDTIEHVSEEEMLSSVSKLIQERHIDHLYVGLPLLPSGKDGSQAGIVRTILKKIEAFGTPCSLIDERYTTPKTGQSDGNAAAACSLLNIALENGS
ncbi:Holliday junction resolvase RuvX [Candidatus Peregrinibacteria bacterium]|nr:Holliday junction resolvase RuvX [Candidatus Peregrinibacteria bacterium]